MTARASAVLYGVRYGLGPAARRSRSPLYSLAEQRGRARRVPHAARVAASSSLAGRPLAALRCATATHRSVLFGAVRLAAAWLAGDRARLRRERIAELEERARRAERDAERERRLAAAEERTRIARDLHDSAGHAINVILVQAGAARLLQRPRPRGRARRSRRSRRSRARRVGEIDQLVRALREDRRRPRERRAAARASPRSTTLAERHRAAGLDVTVARRRRAPRRCTRRSTRPPTGSCRRR